MKKNIFILIVCLFCFGCSKIEINIYEKSEEKDTTKYQEKEYDSDKEKIEENLIKNNPNTDENVDLGKEESTFNNVKDWYSENKEEIKDTNKEIIENDKNTIKEAIDKTKDWYSENKEEIKDTNKEIIEENKNAIKNLYDDVKNWFNSKINN